jgi:hypothetical protein
MKLQRIKFMLLGLAMAGIARADPLVDIGLTDLRTTDSLQADGAGIPVSQVEALYNGNYAPNFASSEFQDTNITLGVNASNSDSSIHATFVANRFYGNTLGVASDVTQVKVLDSSSFLGTGALNVGTIRLPLDLGVRVINNSWIAAYDDDAHNIEAIRRLDYMIAHNNVVVVAADSAGADSQFPKLLATSFNGITVGASGASASGPVQFDSSGARAKPDLVVGTGTPSEATALVSGSAALLLSEAKARKLPLNALATKALLMAGAVRPADWEHGNPGPEDDAQVPLDYRYGAGELRVDRSFAILTAGRRAPGNVSRIGWDIRSAATGNNFNRYTFNVRATAADFTAVLTWNRTFPNVTHGLDFTPSLANLDLTLQRQSGSRWLLVSRSTSDVDNLEELTLDGLPKGTYRLLVHGDRSAQYALAWNADMDPPAAPAAIEDFSPLLHGLPLIPMVVVDGPLTSQIVPEPALLWLMALPLLLSRRRNRR